MSLDASIVIPTYNGASRVPRVLEALVRQNDGAGHFEVTVIDNASIDGTTAAVRAHPAMRALAARGVECRIVNEARRGLTYARIRGVRVAQAEPVCFLDDDNIPEPDFVANGAAAFADEGVGLLVSRVSPRWEVVPSPAVSRRAHLMAVNRELGEAPIDFGAGATIAPTIGAGMWVRRSAFLAAIPWRHPETLLADRIGERLACGGDIELGILIGKAGYRRVYLPNLRVMHEIPPRRCATGYLLQLVSGVVRSQLTLHARYGGAPYDAGKRMAALAALFGLPLAWPYLWLTRGDLLRETLLVAADRWARVRGPYRSRATADPNNLRQCGGSQAPPPTRDPAQARAILRNQ